MTSKQSGDGYCLSCGEIIEEDSLYQNYCDKVYYDLSLLPTDEEKTKSELLTSFEVVLGLFLILESVWIIADPSLFAFRLFLYSVLGIAISAILAAIITLIIIFYYYSYDTTQTKGPIITIRNLRIYFSI